MKRAPLLAAGLLAAVSLAHLLRILFGIRVTVADEIIPIPECHEAVLPIVAAIPVQLLSYYIAVERGCDVDKPRNLA